MLLLTALLSNFHLLHRLLVVQSVPYWSHLNRHRSCTCIRASVLVTSEPSLGRYGREKISEIKQTGNRKWNLTKERRKVRRSCRKANQRKAEGKRNQKENAQKLRLHFWPLSLMTSKGQSAEIRKGKEIMNKKERKESSRTLRINWPLCSVTSKGQSVKDGQGPR